MLLNQYKIIYVLAKAVKEQALADFLADHTIRIDWKISNDLLNDEVFYIDIFLTLTMLFDGFALTDGVRAATKTNTTLFLPTKQAMLQQRR